MLGCRLLLLLFCLPLAGLRLQAQIAGKWGDQANGTYMNPVLPANYSDLDAIRVGVTIMLYLLTCNFRPACGTPFERSCKLGDHWPRG